MGDEACFNACWSFLPNSEQSATEDKFNGTAMALQGWVMRRLIRAAIDHRRMSGKAPRSAYCTEQPSSRSLEHHAKRYVACFFRLREDISLALFSSSGSENSTIEVK